MRDIGYTAMAALINEWCIGRNGERDREIMRYTLLDGLTPTASTCIKLAAFLTIYREMYGQPEYSYAPSPDQKTDEIVLESDSEFAKVVRGRKQGDVWPVIDELMTVLSTMHPRLYRMVLEKLQ